VIGARRWRRAEYPPARSTTSYRVRSFARPIQGNAVTLHPTSSRRRTGHVPAPALERSFVDARLCRSSRSNDGDGRRGRASRGRGRRTTPAWPPNARSAHDELKSRFYSACRDDRRAAAVNSSTRWRRSPIRIPSRTRSPSRTFYCGVAEGAYPARPVSMLNAQPLGFWSSRSVADAQRTRARATTRREPLGAGASPRRPDDPTCASAWGLAHIVTTRDARRRRCAVGAILDWCAARLRNTLGVAALAWIFWPTRRDSRGQLAPPGTLDRLPAGTGLEAPVAGDERMERVPMTLSMADARATRSRCA